MVPPGVESSIYAAATHKRIVSAYLRPAAVYICKAATAKPTGACRSRAQIWILKL
jgi:hypothetical protein